jgi:hypothetical protein
MTTASASGAPPAPSLRTVPLIAPAPAASEA